MSQKLFGGDDQYVRIGGIVAFSPLLRRLRSIIRSRNVKCSISYGLIINTVEARDVGNEAGDVDVLLSCRPQRSFEERTEEVIKCILEALYAADFLEHAVNPRELDEPLVVAVRLEIVFADPCRGLVPIRRLARVHGDAILRERPVVELQRDGIKRRSK